jgi:hypothetical protein
MRLFKQTGLNLHQLTTRSTRIMIERLNFASVSLSSLAAIFFIAGCSAFSKAKGTVVSTNWMFIKAGSFEVYFGLRKAFLSSSNLHGSAEYDESCAADWCDSCSQDGKGAVGLLIIAILFCVAAIMTSACLWKWYSNAGHILNVFITFTSACASLISVGLFMGDCFYDVKNSAKGPIPTDEVQWGPGSKISIIGMFLMWIVSILQIVICAQDKGFVPNTIVKGPVVVCTVAKDV